MKKTNVSSKSGQSSSLYTHFQKFLMFLLKWVIENEDALVRDLGYLVNLKKVFRKYVFLLVMIVASLVLILDGVGLFVGSLFALPPGLVNVIIGIILLIVALIFRKIWKVYGV